MDPVVLDLPTIAWERSPTVNAGCRTADKTQAFMSWAEMQTSWRHFSQRVSGWRWRRVGWTSVPPLRTSASKLKVTIWKEWVCKVCRRNYVPEDDTNKTEILLKGAGVEMLNGLYLNLRNKLICHRFTKVNEFQYLLQQKGEWKIKFSVSCNKSLPCH